MSLDTTQITAPIVLGQVGKSAYQHYASTTTDNPVTNAANSDATATTKASEAETSATNANNSETAASGSATTATTKASEAETSATNAANSATTATTKASEAETSATNANNSETAAAGSATTATTKASEAETSATNASNSAAAAAGLLVNNDALQTLNDAPLVAWDASAGRNTQLTLTELRRLGLITNAHAGQSGVLWVYGGFGLVLDFGYNDVLGTLPTLVGAAVGLVRWHTHDGVTFDLYIHAQPVFDHLNMRPVFSFDADLGVLTTGVLQSGSLDSVSGWDDRGSYNTDASQTTAVMQPAKLAYGGGDGYAYLPLTGGSNLSCGSIAGLTATDAQSYHVQVNGVKVGSLNSYPLATRSTAGGRLSILLRSDGGVNVIAGTVYILVSSAGLLSDGDNLDLLVTWDGVDQVELWSNGVLIQTEAVASVSFSSEDITVSGRIGSTLFQLGGQWIRGAIYSGKLTPTTLDPALAVWDLDIERDAQDNATSFTAKTGQTVQVNGSVHIVKSNKLLFDGDDDGLEVTLPAVSGTLVTRTNAGTTAADVVVTSGVHTLSNTGLDQPLSGGTLTSAVLFDYVLTPEGKTAVIAQLNS